MIPRNITPLIDEIFESGRSEIEKLSAAFHLITNFHIEHSKNECELFRATGDRESLVKEQIKYSTMGHMLNVYAECFYRATGSHWEQEGSNE
jgi:hypothetical protein